MTTRRSENSIAAWARGLSESRGSFSVQINAGVLFGAHLPPSGPSSLLIHAARRPLLVRSELLQLLSGAAAASAVAASAGCRISLQLDKKPCCRDEAALLHPEA